MRWQLTRGSQAVMRTGFMTWTMRRSSTTRRWRTFCADRSAGRDPDASRGDICQARDHPAENPLSEGRRQRRPRRTRLKKKQSAFDEILAEKKQTARTVSLKGL